MQLGDDHSEASARKLPLTRRCSPATTSCCSRESAKPQLATKRQSGEYAAGAVRRFANLAVSEDWLGLMNVIERAGDPGIDCLTYMVKWSLKQDEAPPTPAHEGCTCGGNGGCS